MLPPMKELPLFLKGNLISWGRHSFERSSFREVHEEVLLAPDFLTWLSLPLPPMRRALRRPCTFPRNDLTDRASASASLNSHSQMTSGAHPAARKSSRCFASRSL